MFVKALISKCEFTNRKYDTFVEGAFVLTMNKDGSVTDVLEAGPEYIKKQNAYVGDMYKLPAKTQMSIRNLMCF